MLRSILHCDMNNFYASVECMLDPALKKYPIAVCGSVEERHGIVLAKNYKAKAFDVKTGDAVWQAKQKCKDLVVVPPHYEEYIKYSKLARSVYERYTDQVEPYGMDECWLDISGTESLFGSPEKVANEIRETMKFELGLTISVGVSFNKIQQYKKCSLLILDEWLLYPLKETEARDLLEIAESRYKNASTIFCSQFAVAGWREKIGDPILADAICDRIVHDSYQVVIDCKESMRKRKGVQELGD